MRSTGSLAGFALVAAASLVPTAAATQDGALEGLLRLHHEQRVAHVLDDADLLSGALAAGFVEVGRGRVTVPSRGTARHRFADYLGGVRFLEWDDVRPPRIRLSPDGAWSEVIVEKRVRSIPTDTTKSRATSSAVFAWVGRWVRTDSTWRLATIASTQRRIDDEAPVPSLAARVRAWEILRRARETLGGEGVVARVGTLRFIAECEGPGGPFVTEVTSARDGRVRLAQRFPNRPDFAAGVGLDGSWRRVGAEEVVDSLGPALGTVVTAHEMHLLAIAPEARYSAPVARPSRRLDGRQVEVVEFVDALGAPVRFFYDATTGLPTGFRPVDHSGPGTARISIRFDDWREVGEVRLPFRIRIDQGGDTFLYRVSEASTDWLSDPAFRPGGW